ncbi:MAG: hypothetical protein J1E63_04360 [Muribaculaceae bacterium]|nr:hypothetical protein [Muribaculaceae bacterium]
MKKFAVLFVVALCCLSFGISTHAQVKKVAVYVEGNIDADSKSIVNAAAMARLSGHKDYAPFERDEAFLNAAQKEQDYQVSGDVPDSEIRKLAGRLGVDFVMVIKVTITRDDVCQMTARLMNIETGAVLKSVEQSRPFTGSDVLSPMTKNVVYRLLDKKSR